MEIFGLGLVALCMFIGSLVGRLFGTAIGISGDVGGVGFSMLLLILITSYMEGKKISFHTNTEKGILLLSALYIPVVVAMSSIQNVVAAFEGGLVAFTAGGVATLGGLLLVPVITKLTVKSANPNESTIKKA